MKLTKSLILCFFLIFASTALADKTVYRIGAVLPLSGNLAFVGKDIQRGMLLANKELGKDSNIKIIFEDGKFDANSSLRAANKLIQVNQVNALVSLWDMADIVASVSEKSKIPHVAIRWNSKIAIENKYTFTFETTYQSVVREQVSLLKDIGVKSISILGSLDKSTENAFKETIKVSKKEGIEVRYAKLVSKIDEGFNTFLLRAIKSKSDVVMFWFFPPFIELALKKSLVFKMKAMPFGMFNDIPKEDKHLVRGLPFVRMYKVDKAFEKKFKNEYGEMFELRAPHAYDITMLLSKAFSKPSNGDLKSDRVLNYLSKITNYKGATGILNVNNRKGIETGVFRTIVDHKKMRDLTEVDLTKIKERFKR